MASCCDILTGLGEMLTLEQFNRVSYPWQSFDYEASDRWMEIAYKTLEIIGEVAEKTEKVSNDINSIKHKGGSTTTQTGAASASQPSDESAGSQASGYGTISGPMTLKRGSTATYKLYVGGSLVNAEWRQGGTSISVYGAGDHGRVMAGNPPIKSGKFRTSIKATYNGKTYSKTIYIQK